MTTLTICLFISLLLPFLAKLPVAIAMHKLGGYDNNHPREQQNQLTGFGARALAAHQNSFEALIIFAPAVILAIATNNLNEQIQIAAIIHVIARISYILCYLANLGTLRSIVWAIGLIASFTIVWQCIP